MHYDFSGYASKNDLKCSDGRTIRKNAFAHNDGTQVPLVWQHMHNEPGNILGHAILENRKDGVYAYCKFNKGEAATQAKELLRHGDIDSLSIFANRLKEKDGNVIHGQIREVSLVLVGANPGAKIENISLMHSDGFVDESEDEAIIHTGIEIDYDDEYDEDDYDDEDDEDEDDEDLEHSGMTVEEVFDTFDDDQLELVYALISNVIEEQEGSVEHSDTGGRTMKKNIFDRESQEYDNENVLSHAEFAEIVKDTREKKGSLKQAFLAHAQTYGIENIDFLFPDAKSLTEKPTFISRDMDWVSELLGSTKNTPFARVKSLAADITMDEARARGYIKGTEKKEEVFKLLKRITEPTTIYKKQKLDRDDVIDITEFDVVAWMRGEMDLMLKEEIARAVLIGDGRSYDDESKINEENIRPVYLDDELYSHKHEVAADLVGVDLIDNMLLARKNYKGKGRPNFYASQSVIFDLLLIRDKIGRRLYDTIEQLASALGVNKIVEVELMEGLKRTDDKNITRYAVGIFFNPADYNIGTNAGGKTSMFDDFDIDFNQLKYLIETRLSGALVNPKTALVIERAPVEAQG